MFRHYISNGTVTLDIHTLILFFQSLDLAGFTPLHYAAWYCRERIAQNLLSFDIDPNQSGTVNDRPLHFGNVV